MQEFPIDQVLEAARRGMKVQRYGHVCEVGAGIVRVSGLAGVARIGDPVRLPRPDGSALLGEVVELRDGVLTAVTDGSCQSIALDDLVYHAPAMHVSPSEAWLGRVLDPFGEPLDDAAPVVSVDPPPPSERIPSPTRRKPLGQRLNTGLAVMNTMLPLVRGQRIGLFAGSGVGKTTLLLHLARYLEADAVVVALVGERGRELHGFCKAIAEAGLSPRTTIIAATSDRSPLSRRKCLETALDAAETFRDEGKHVLLLADSLTRYGEAHRELALAAGEPPALGGFPASMAQRMMRLCERAGPGEEQHGDITAVFSVLVAGSDMEGPVADIARGVLDGHVVLNRAIAERGRFPAIDVLQSVSRALPEAATPEENALIKQARQMISLYEQTELLVQSGLYTQGSDPATDAAHKLWPMLEKLWADTTHPSPETSFTQLGLLLRRAGV